MVGTKKVTNLNLVKESKKKKLRRFHGSAVILIFQGSSRSFMPR